MVHNIDEMVEQTTQQCIACLEVARSTKIHSDVGRLIRNTNNVKKTAKLEG